MKHLIKYSSFLTVLITLLTSSCEKFSGDNEGITGSWRCRDESGSGGFRQYTVTIDRTDLDTTMFKVYNFHNLGFEIETYFRLKDTVATIIGTMDGSYSITGKGYVKKNYSSIRWEYSVSGNGINHSYVQAYYDRR